MGLEATKQSSVTPAPPPYSEGNATKRAINTEECKHWILLFFFGSLNLERRRLTSHS